MKRLALVLLAACADGQGPAPTSAPEPAPAAAPAPAAEPAPAAAAEPAPVPLADSPTIDLAANAIRWHLHDAGLLVPVATEGLRKYALDYRSPWGDVRAVDGEPGRALTASKATLTIPWDADGPARVVVRARGKGTLSVGKLGKRKLDGTWQDLAFEGTLAAGEVVLALAAPRGTLVQSVEVIPDGAAATGCRALTPAPRPGALGGVARMSLHLEIPAGAYLVATAEGDGAARVTVTSAAGETQVLHDGPAPRGETRWPLDGFADQLVRLDLEAPGCDVVWAAPRIALTLPPPPAKLAPAQHLVLVVVDTLRADRLAAYRPDTRVRTPRLTAALAERGVVFPRNQAMAPSSPPSHATIHTGQIPRVHGATGDTGDVVAGAPVLSAILGDAGFHTAYVGNNDFAMGRLRKVAGWDVAKTMIYEGKGIDCAPMVEEVLAIVGEVKAAGKRAFVTMLPIEPHVPYRYHEGITETYYPGPYDKPLGKRATSAHLGAMRKVPLTSPRWDHLRGLYDGEVEYFDGCYGALEDGLAELGVLDDTAIVLTSDHGEGLGERGGHTGHAYGLHGELIEVPFVVIGTQLPAGVVDVVTSNADIAPTALELLGLPPDERIQGASLVAPALARAPWPHRIVASEYGRAYALRGGRWRLVVGYDGTATLHDVVADPEEATDVSKEQPMARRWLREAAGLYLAHRTAWRAGSWGGLGDLAASSPLAPAVR